MRTLDIEGYVIINPPGVVEIERGYTLFVRLLISMVLMCPLVAAAQNGEASDPQGSQTQLPLLIGVGDLLDVSVFDTPELSFKGRVDNQGQITLPVGGKVTVAGIDTVAAGKLVEAQLSTANVMPSSSVTVLDTEYATQGINVLGEVRQPGTYTLLGPHSLYDALSSAGGPLDTEGPRITITHRNDPDHPEIVDVSSPNYSETQRKTRVYPGDTVYVSKAGMVYVIGDVAHPGAFYLSRGQSFSVLNVVALASGLNFTASEKHCAIVRPISDKAITIPLNLTKIKLNQDENTIMIAGDVLVVPRSTLKQLLITAVPGATAAVTSAVATALVVR